MLQDYFKECLFCFLLLLSCVLFHILTPLGYNCIRQETGQMRFPASNEGVQLQNMLCLSVKYALNVAQQFTDTCS